MAIIEAADYRYAYAGEERDALSLPAFSVERGEMLLLIGANGSGKTTLLRRVAETCRNNRGEVHTAGYRGKSTGELRVDAGLYGYVWQDPESQLVCHRVEQEIVFGMENLGYSVPDMQRRLAEIVTFFGLEGVLHREVQTLSAGEQQMVNTTGAIACKPDILLLDEPTGALDPMAAERLAGLIRKLHEETGMTILIAEQRPSLFYEMADRVIFMKNGEVCFDGSYPEFAEEAVKTSSASEPDGPFNYLSAQARLVLGQGAPAQVITDKRALRNWIVRHPVEEETVDAPETEEIHVRHVFFRYKKESGDVLSDCDFSLKTGRITALVGGNGSGKTTLAEVIGGYLKPYRGKIQRAPEAVSYLPANPSYLFLEPLDGSGGEREWEAITHVLDREASLYILDEPTRGLDPFHKNQLSEKLRAEREQGKTLLIVTHDMEFAAEIADEMVMMFDGKVTACGRKQEFLCGNVYYTTEYRRLLSWG